MTRGASFYKRRADRPSPGADVEDEVARANVRVGDELPCGLFSDPMPTPSGARPSDGHDAPSPSSCEEYDGVRHPRRTSFLTCSSCQLPPRSAWRTGYAKTCAEDLHDLRVKRRRSKENSTPVAPVVPGTRRYPEARLRRLRPDTLIYSYEWFEDDQRVLDAVAPTRLGRSPCRSAGRLPTRPFRLNDSARHRDTPRPWSVGMGSAARMESQFRPGAAGRRRSRRGECEYVDKLGAAPGPGGAGCGWPWAWYPA